MALGLGARGVGGASKKYVDNKFSNFVDTKYMEIQLSIAGEGYYTYNTGDVTPFPGSNYYYAEPILVQPGEVYTINGISSFSSNLYIIVDSNGVILSVFPNVSAADKTYYNTDFEIPENGFRLLINDYKNSTVLKKAVGFDSDKLRVAIIGDSLWEKNITTARNSVYWLEKLDGYEIQNLAKSGAGYKKDDGVGEAFYQQALLISPDTQVVLFAGSFNDISQITGGFPLGTIDDIAGTGSIYALIKLAFSNARNIVSDVKICVETPIPWTGYTPMDDSSTTQIQYVNAILDVCRNEGVECLDLFRQSNLRPWEADFRLKYYYKGDGNHPNGIGHKNFMYAPTSSLIRRTR